ncbi:uncharacterized protein MP3633_0607 [Marinomonas primoryensis]|uniref:Uncharacterized protein n=1 Tax=Marinomonas primoryensis TaxID=178399 RepID=A0A859CT01_9GAMM|nr:uncharacterized protein MP3633_0607 [Marinomonas primoryensis]
MFYLKPENKYGFGLVIGKKVAELRSDMMITCGYIRLFMINNNNKVKHV